MTGPAASSAGPVPVPVPPEVRALADDLAPGVWPTADVPALRQAAARCRDLAARASVAADDIAAAHRDLARGSGHFHDGVVAAQRLLSGTPGTGVDRAVTRLEAAAAALDDYADAAVHAHNEMAVVASVADRERLRGDLLTTLGDDSARVMAAGAGRLALTAAGEEFTGQAEKAGDRHDDGDQPTPAATSGMMPFSAMGGLAAGAGALAGGHAATERDDVSALSTADTEWLQRRAAQLQSRLPASVAGAVRMAIGIGLGPDGSRTVVVGSDDPYPYEREGVGIAADEILVGNGRAAELAIVDHMNRSGAMLAAIAAATPMEPGTLAALTDLDAELIAPSDFHDPVFDIAGDVRVDEA